jgi:hypothetical protein
MSENLDNNPEAQLAYIDPDKKPQTPAPQRNGSDYDKLKSATIGGLGGTEGFTLSQALFERFNMTGNSMYGILAVTASLLSLGLSVASIKNFIEIGIHVFKGTSDIDF